MNKLKQELIAEKGKFTLWKSKNISAKRDQVIYQICRGNKVIDEFDNEREALSELELQNRLEVQARAFGPGM